MTRRKLTPEEIELWRKVTEKTERLHSSSALPPPVLPKPKPLKPVVPRGEPPKRPAPAKVNGHKPPKPLAPVAPNMDSKTFRRLKRGKLKPEGRIDLHGLTLEQARPELVRFVLNAQASDKRLVLVITGKGRDRDEGGPVPTRKGILRQYVPQWLGSAPLAQAVIEVTPAHVTHGGEGAFYVYLRRRR